MATRCDVAVVGLGLVGAAALRHLSATGGGASASAPTEPVDWSNARGRVRQSLRLRPHHAPARQAARVGDPGRQGHRRVPGDRGASRASTFHHPVGVVMADVDADRIAAITAVAEGLGVAFEQVRSRRVVRRRPRRRSRRARRCSASRRQAASSIRAGCWPRSSPSPGSRAPSVVGEQVVGDRAVGRRVDGAHHAGGTEIEAAHVVIAAGPHADEIDGLPRKPLIDVVAETVVLARVSAAEQQRLAGPALDHRRRRRRPSLHRPADRVPRRAHLREVGRDAARPVGAVAGGAAGVDDWHAARRPTSTGCTA